MPIELTASELAILVDCERKMDAGIIPFVMYGNHRVALVPEIMIELGLLSGQTISDEIFSSLITATRRFSESICGRK